VPSGWRGNLAFDPSDCRLHVLAVDLDGGPYHRDVRVARLWDGAEWRWADDWRVEGTQLLRPGMAPRPVGSWPERLEVDARGGVIARVLDGRRLEVLRDEAGSFLGMQRGSVRVSLVPEGVVASDGRTTLYTLWGTRVDATAGPAGKTVYGYDGSGLRTILWPDGAAIRLEADGTSGLGGRWRCTRTDNVVRIEGGDGRWTVTDTRAERVTTDGQGGTMRTRWEEGALAGWVDADGVAVELARDDEGRLESVRRDGETVARLSWAPAGLSELRDGAGPWRLFRDGEGSVTRRAEPDGRGPTFEVSAGHPRVVRRGAESAVVTWDPAGRPARLQAGPQGEARLDRDGAGRLVRVTDGAGGIWTLEREPGGAPRALLDPAGRRWELRTDESGHLTRLAGPDGIAWSATRSQGRLAQLTRGASRWSWLRDGAGRLTGVRDPEGRLTGIARDPFGNVVSVRLPDGSGHTLGRDELGRLRSVDDWRVARDAHGFATEVRGPGGALAGWSRDGAGRATGFGMGDVSFEFARDAAGRVSSVRAGEGEAERWRLDRDAAGRVSAVTAADGGQVQLSRDSAGLVVKVTDALGTLTLSRDLRGRIARVVAEHTWIVGRDVSGRVVRVEVDGMGAVGADYDPDGNVCLLRMPDGALVRRNASADAAELLATDHDGASVGTAGWTTDDSGLVLTLVAGGRVNLARDAGGRLVSALGPEGEWAEEAGLLRAPDGSKVRVDAAGRPTAVSLTEGGPWGLGAGEAAFRWEGDRLTGLDGSAGGASLVHDGLGRPTQLTLGDRTVAIQRDALGRLRRVGEQVLTGWDALLAIGRAPRVPFPNGIVARPGGAVLGDPRGHALLVPWAPPVRPWPTGWLRSVDAAEVGAGGRYVLPGGVLLGFLRAVDPLSGASTTPDRWPWIRRQPELAADVPLFPEADGNTDAPWDPSSFDRVRAWSDPLASLVEADWLPGGGSEPTEAPGLPWLPASFARTLPAPMAGHGAIALDEDPAGRLLLRAAIEGRPLDDDGILDAFLGVELRAEAVDLPGFRLPGPPFLGASLADSPFGH
jgi:YD repeat-containing protein